MAAAPGSPPGTGLGDDSPGRAPAGGRRSPRRAAPESGRQERAAGERRVGSDTSPGDVAARLHSAAIHLLRRLRREDESSGLSAARLSALSVLVFGGPRTLGDLAAAEQVSAPTMSRLARVLEADGLIEREPDAADGRVVWLRASPAGVRVLEAARAARLRRLEELLSGLEPAELELLGRTARLIEHVLARPEPGP